MVAAIKEVTPNYAFQLPNYDVPGWGAAVSKNFKVTDAVLFAATGLGNVKGIWLNSTIYAQGDRVVDGDSGIVYQCVIGNTSASTGSFLADRLAHPTYWKTSNPGAISRGAWTTATNYNINEFVVNGNQWAVVTANHTSTTFAADVASGKLSVLVDLTLADPSQYATKTGNNTFTGANVYQGTFNVQGALQVNGIPLSKIVNIVNSHAAYNTTTGNIVNGAVVTGVDILANYTPKDPVNSKLAVFVTYSIAIFGPTAAVYKTTAFFFSVRCDKTTAGSFVDNVSNSSFGNSATYYGTAENDVQIFGSFLLNASNLNPAGKWNAKPLASTITINGTFSTANIFAVDTLLIEYL